jgi:hypothetical protein
VLGVLRRLHPVDENVILNLPRQQIAMLKTDLLRCALQMHIRPSALVELVGTVKTRVGRCGSGCGERG